MPKKYSASKVLHFEPEEDEEENEEKEGEVHNELDHELFAELTEGLDESIDESMEETYRETLDTFNQALGGACKSSDSVPTLFLCGHCLDWDWFFNRLRKRRKNLVIKDYKFSNVLEEFETESENDENAERLKKDGRTLILFFQNNNNFSKREVFERILSLVGENRFVLLVVHTSLSFASLDEQIPRSVFVQLRIIKAVHLPSAALFLDAFSPNKRGFLAKANVHFHGKTLAFVRRMFLREFRTLASVRKALVSALHEYATEYGGEKRPNAQEQREFAIVMKRYFASLRAFVVLTDQNELPNAEEFTFKLHCHIQNRANFAALYAKQKPKWEQWTVDKWQNKIATIGKIIVDKCHNGKCKELAAKLDEQRNRSRTEQSENAEPSKKAFDPRIKRSAKTAKMFADQQQLRNRLINPLDTELFAELLQFLDELFLHNLQPFPAKFVAGPGPLSLLDPSLSGELDRCLTEQTDAISQLDIVSVYRLFVTHSSYSYTFHLSSLRKAFCCLVKPIEGLTKEARFLAAVAQLEYIGMVKSLSDDFVRLIYLPGAALHYDLYENWIK